MRTKYHAHLTFFCLIDTECHDISDELDFDKIPKNFVTPPPDVTIPEYSRTPAGYFATLFPFLESPAIFDQAEYTHTLMGLYFGFNAAWAVTCFIAIGKWKERAVEDSC
jgi:hypothetical protein